MARRIESTTSQTAEMTCLARAFSFYESNPFYKSNDSIAPVLLPDKLRLLLPLSFARHLFMRAVAPKGIYEYVIARTKYIDAAFIQAMNEHFDQVLIFGAGFDTRALRFSADLGNIRIFELDAPVTQQAKIGQYQKRGLLTPQNLTFIPIDFDRESLPEKLIGAGFVRGKRSLFVLEGLLMYLQRESVEATFQSICEFAGHGSRVVFDYVYSSVLKDEGKYYGANGIKRRASKVGEQWTFGLEKDQIASFLKEFGLQLLNQKDAPDLEKMYFTGAHGKRAGRVNGAHCLVTAELR